MTRLWPPKTQSARIDLRNRELCHDPADAGPVPTIGVKLLYCLVFLTHDRRELVHHAVTAHPTTEWLARRFASSLRANLTFDWDNGQQGNPGSLPHEWSPQHDCDKEPPASSVSH